MQTTNVPAAVQTTNAPAAESTAAAADAFRPHQQQFIKWLAIPKPLRVPASRREYANLLGVQPDTLTRWTHLPNFWDAVYDECKDLVADRLPEVMDSLTERAVEGSIQSIKLYLEALGLLLPQEQNLNVKMQQEQLVVVLDSTEVQRAQTAQAKDIPGVANAD